MLRQPIDFDWQIGEDIRWPSGDLLMSDWTVYESPNDSRREVQVATGLLRALLLLFVAFNAVASQPFSANQVARARAEKGIRFALAQEQRLQTEATRHQYQALLDSSVSSQWRKTWRAAWEHGLDQDGAFRVTLLAVEAQADLAVATVLVEDPAPNWGGNSVYREKRYYRSHGQDWLRTVPPPNFWGNPQYLETEYFRLEYYAPDTATVYGASTELDRLYSQLYHELGLSQPKAAPQTFALVPELIQYWRSYDNRVELTSPSLASIPAALTDEEYLRYTIASRLTYRAIQEAMARNRTGTEYRWNLVLWGLRSWLLTDLLGQQSPWATEATAALRKRLRTEPQVNLELLNRFYLSSQPDEDELMSRYLLAESMVSYALTTYGIDRLPVLLQGFSFYSTWKALIPHVFDVSMEEFEAGWQVYVLETYRSE